MEKQIRWTGVALIALAGCAGSPRDPTNGGPPVARTCNGEPAMAEEAGEGRTLVFSFDGTNDDPGLACREGEGLSITNVLKGHMLMGGRPEQGKTKCKGKGGRVQTLHYYAGIGTPEELPERLRDIPIISALVDKVEASLAPSRGEAMAIVKKGLEDLGEARPSRDDAVVAIGFSRGAALARRFVHEAIAQAKVEGITFLGIYDTVDDFNGQGIVKELVNAKRSEELADQADEVSTKVERVVHLVALDEERQAFKPVLVKRTEGEGEVTEIWFPGVHTNVGGGEEEDGLSDGALSYMMKALQQRLGGKLTIADGKDGKQVQGLLSKMGQGSKKADGGCKVTTEELLIREDPTGAEAKQAAIWQRLHRGPRHVRVEGRSEKSDGVPVVHESVIERIRTLKDYRPPSLEGRAYRVECRDGTEREGRGVEQEAQCDEE